MSYNSLITFNFSSTVWPDLVRAAREDAPELFAHQARDRRALVQAVILGHRVEHREVPRRGREGADSSFLHCVASASIYNNYIIIILCTTVRQDDDHMRVPRSDTWARNGLAFMAICPCWE